MTKKLNLKSLDLTKISNSHFEQKKKQNISKEKELIDIKRKEELNDVVEKEDDLADLNKLKEELKSCSKFIKKGNRQQITINASDYTLKLIEILLESYKVHEGEMIKKTSYLEKLLRKSIEKELKQFE